MAHGGCAVQLLCNSCATCLLPGFHAGLRSRVSSATSVTTFQDLATQIPTQALQKLRFQHQLPYKIGENLPTPVEGGLSSSFSDSKSQVLRR